MAEETVTIWDDVLIEASTYTIVAGEPIDLLTQQFSNTSSPVNALIVSGEFSDLDPFEGLNGGLAFIVEYEVTSGVWVPLVSQGQSFIKQALYPQRILQLDPLVSASDSGLDSVISPLGQDTLRITREKGSLPARPFRVCIRLIDNDPAGSFPFTSVVVNASLEKRNV